MKARMNSSFPTFLSAFDPSDLPGGSMDPLGFDRAYSSQADKVLPGLTNVAAYPRYFSLLCAGARLAAVGGGGTVREQLRVRQQSI